MIFKPITNNIICLFPLLITVTFLYSLIRSYFFWRKYEYNSCGFLFAHFMRLKGFYLDNMLNASSRNFMIIVVIADIIISIFGNKNLANNWKQYDLASLPNGTHCFAMQVESYNYDKEYTLPAEVVVTDGDSYVSRAYWTNGGYLDFEDFEKISTDEAVYGFYYENKGQEYNCRLLDKPSYSQYIDSYHYMAKGIYDWYSVVNLITLFFAVILTSYYLSKAYDIRHNDLVERYYLGVYKKIDKDFMSKSNAFCTSAFSIKEFAKQPFILSAMFFEITKRCRYGTSTMPFVVYAACEIGKLRFPDAETEFEEENWKYIDGNMGFANEEECQEKIKHNWEEKREYWNYIYYYARLLYDDMEPTECYSRMDEYTDVFGQISPFYKPRILDGGSYLSEIGYEYRAFIKAFVDSDGSCCSAGAKVSGMQMEDMVAEFIEKRGRH